MRFRPDIQGLRAVAVLAVLVFHLWPSRVTGGFVGVDVFFVISGYLIIGGIAERVVAGRLSLVEFWGRRAARLLPAAVVVIVVCVVVTLTWVAPTERHDSLRGLLASALYVQNWNLAVLATDYFSSGAPTIAQHFWSLSVEEQLYIVVPLIAVLVLAVTRAARRPGGAAAAVLLIVLTLASFLYGVIATSATPQLAYFSTFARAWEFGIGGVAAVLGARIAVRLGRAPAQVLGSAGLAAVVASVLLIRADAAFPGWIALVPVLGAVAVLLAGRSAAPRVSASRLLAIGPLVKIGDWSYSIYLWHWPLIIAIPAATGAPLGTGSKIVVFVASIAIGWASTRWIEQPFRVHRRPGRARIAAVAGLLATAVVVSGSGILLVNAQASGAQAAAQHAAAIGGSCFGAPSLAARGCAVPTAFVPAPAGLAQDDGNEAPCWTTNGQTTFRTCTFGPTSAAIDVLIVGDSHSNSLIPAYRAIAAREGWHVVLTAKAGCYWTTAPLAVKTDPTGTECRTWNASLAHYLDSHPAFDAIVVTHFEGTGLPSTSQGRSTETADLVAAWSSEAARGVPIIALRDVPRFRTSIVGCMLNFLGAAQTKCTEPRSAAYPVPDSQQAAVALTSGAVFVDTSSLYCGSMSCAPVIGGVAVFRDNEGHLTATYARSEAPALAALVCQEAKPLCRD